MDRQDTLGTAASSLTGIQHAVVVRRLLDPARESTRVPMSLRTTSQGLASSRSASSMAMLFASSPENAVCAMRSRFLRRLPLRSVAGEVRLVERLVAGMGSHETGAP